MTERPGLSKRDIVAELTRSPHGDLRAYENVGRAAATADPAFFAHLIAWNHAQGNITDSKIALPVLALFGTRDPEWVENALAALATLKIAEFLKAVDFRKVIGAPDRPMRRLVSRYLADLEHDEVRWMAGAIRKRRALKRLYALSHISTPLAKAALFDGTAAGPFAALKALRTADPETCAAAIRNYRLPFIAARGALGKTAYEPVVMSALIASASSTEITTNMKWFTRHGVTPEQIKAATAKIATGTRNVLKASKAAEAVESVEVKAAIRAAQETAISQTAGIDGNWLVLGDASPSMQEAIEAAKEIAAVLARLVKGHVDLTFFNSTPTSFDVTGKTLEEIKTLTRGVGIGGGTSIGCGIMRAIEVGRQVDGIAIISDGEENTPTMFAAAYQAYVKRFDIEPTVYLYLLRGSGNPMLSNARAAGIDVQMFDLRAKATDYYAMTDVARTMRVGKYSLIDEIMATPLLKLDQVLPRTAAPALATV